MAHAPAHLRGVFGVRSHRPTPRTHSATPHRELHFPHKTMSQLGPMPTPTPPPPNTQSAVCASRSTPLPLIMRPQAAFVAATRRAPARLHWTQPPTLGAYRALCARCAKSWQFSTTVSSVSSED